MSDRGLYLLPQPSIVKSGHCRYLPQKKSNSQIWNLILPSEFYFCIIVEPKPCSSTYLSWGPLLTWQCHHCLKVYGSLVPVSLWIIRLIPDDYVLLPDLSKSLISRWGVRSKHSRLCWTNSLKLLSSLQAAMNSTELGLHSSNSLKGFHNFT